MTQPSATIDQSLQYEGIQQANIRQNDSAGTLDTATISIKQILLVTQ